MKLNLPASALLAVLCLTAAIPGLGQDRMKERLRVSLKDDLAGPWIYDDIKAGFARAKKTGKPVLAVLR